MFNKITSPKSMQVFSLIIGYKFKRRTKFKLIEILEEPKSSNWMPITMTKIIQFIF